MTTITREQVQMLFGDIELAEITPEAEAACENRFCRAQTAVSALRALTGAHNGIMFMTRVLCPACMAQFHIDQPSVRGAELTATLNEYDELSLWRTDGTRFFWMFARSPFTPAWSL